MLVWFLECSATQLRVKERSAFFRVSTRKHREKTNRHDRRSSENDVAPSKKDKTRIYIYIYTYVSRVMKKIGDRGENGDKRKAEKITRRG